ncbi:MAG: transketolase [Candidatus Izemoplasmatales bacterium]|nr:transketolase [Candidatus Izemoplasmatales bacterium]
MEKTVNAIRFLGLDMINEANSGHPGIVLDAAPVIYSLFQYHLNAYSKQPNWFNRDRFFLAAGHGSALLYSTLHFAGYDIPMAEIKRFRQLGSLTPGHPEYRHTPGVDATTGPLGQGVAMAVGSAIAETYLRNTFNKDGLEVVNHYTYALCGDGDLQEGVTLEALSLAGHLGLDRLIILFDSNDVQLDGPTKNAVSENIKMKMESVGFDYQLVSDANDVLEVSIAIEKAKQSGRPAFIEIKSIIGFGSPKQGTSATHGSPIGKESTLKMKETFGYLLGEFQVDESAYQDMQNRFGVRGERNYLAWKFYMEEYKNLFPNEYKQLTDIIDHKIEVDFESLLKQESIGFVEATRNSIGKVILKLSEQIISMIGGSADLTGSTKVKGTNGNFTKDTPLGRNVNFGVREHAMAAIVNGMTLHSLKAFSGGFFIFSDYMKPAIRLASLMHIPSIFIFTHDSVAVGEDGPTHEPIEQLSMFRTLPNMNTIRPANANEVKHAIRFALESSRTPSTIVLTRQDTVILNDVSYSEFKQGAYIAKDYDDFEGIIIATGSEVELAIKASNKLYELGHKVRVVSMPCMELFISQSQVLQEKILPSSKTNRLAIEMGSSGLWYRFSSKVKGIDTFGVSAKPEDVLSYFGFTVDNIVSLYLGEK